MKNVSKLCLIILSAIIAMTSCDDTITPLSTIDSDDNSIVMSRCSGSVLKVPQDYPTIHDAVNAASSNDTIMISAGDYDYIDLQSVVIDGLDNLKIIGGGANKTIIRNATLEFSNCCGCLVKDLWIDGSTWLPVTSRISSIVYVGMPPACENYSLTVENSIFTNSNVGMYLDGNNKIVNNVITNTLGFRNSFNLYFYSSQHSPVIKNNIFSNSNLNILQGGGSPVIEYNDFFNIGNPTLCIGCIAPPGAGNIMEDPLFADLLNGDFHLQQDSPCIGAGLNGVDMGAFPDN